MKVPAFYSEDMKELLSTDYFDEEILVEAGLIEEAKEEEPLTAEQEAKLAEVSVMLDDIFLEAHGGNRDFLGFMKSNAIRLLEEQITTYKTAFYDIGLAYDSKADMLRYEGKPDRE